MGMGTHSSFAGFVTEGVASVVRKMALLHRRGAVTGASAAEPLPGPFDSVPSAHPAYSTVAYLQDQAGCFTGYSPGAFAGKRLFIRHQFAGAILRIHADLARFIHRASSPGPCPSSGLAGGRGAAPASKRLLHTFRDPDKLQQVLTWHQALVAEFATELSMHGADPIRMTEKAAAWEADAARYAELARGKRFVL
jgi:hypothetical protein